MTWFLLKKKVRNFISKNFPGENGWALATKVGTNNKGFLPISYYSYVKYDPKSK
jgi:hypothetical protein